MRIRDKTADEPVAPIIPAPFHATQRNPTSKMAAIAASNFAVAARPTVARKLSSKKAALSGASPERAQPLRAIFVVNFTRDLGPSKPWSPCGRDARKRARRRSCD